MATIDWRLESGVRVTYAKNNSITSLRRTPFCLGASRPANNGWAIYSILAVDKVFLGGRMGQSEVLIIGAGPSGLFAAAELARHGVQARLVERELQPHREARATAIQPGTLEILDIVGLLPAFLEAAEHVHCSRLYGPEMSVLASLIHDGIDCGCEF